MLKKSIKKTVKIVNNIAKQPEVIDKNEIMRKQKQLLISLRTTIDQVQCRLHSHLTSAEPFTDNSESIAGLVRSLGQTIERLINLERIVFDICAGEPQSDEVSDCTDLRVEIERRLSRLAIGTNTSPSLE